jgi:hypothetical protein
MKSRVFVIFFIFLSCSGNNVKFSDKRDMDNVKKASCVIDCYYRILKSSKIDSIKYLFSDKFYKKKIRV